MSVSTISCVFIFSIKLAMCAQNAYTVTHERVALNDYNEEYLQDPKVVLFWYNRTMKAFNGSTSLKQDLGLNIQMNVTVYKFTNNQFRLYPVDFKKDFCDFLKLNLFGAKDIGRAINVINCPILQGYYSLANVIPNVEKFPHYLIPYGRYRMLTGLHTENIFLANIFWQGEVKSMFK